MTAAPEQVGLHVPPTVDVRPCSTGDTGGFADRQNDPGHVWDVTIRLEFDAGQPVVLVAGVLQRPGGALLTAVVEYVRQQHGGRVAVDLGQVSQVDSHGLAAVIASGADVTSASPRVRRALKSLARSRGTDRQRMRSPDPSCRDPATVPHPPPPGLQG
jgi:ABC-type transporter Mla MlaB component